MIQLFINDKPIDIGKDEKILFTFQRSDFQNPAIVRNSFSKTITLQGTDNNNNVFNQIWKLDRIQRSNFFNASKRVPFYMLKDGIKVEEGYVKLDKIKMVKNLPTYEITLYGALGNILYNLAYGIGENEDETLNLGNLIYDVDLTFNINKDTVYDAWTDLDNTQHTVQNSKWKIINFIVADNGKPALDGFASDKMNVSCDTSSTDGNSWYKENDATNYKWNQLATTSEGVGYSTVKAYNELRTINDTYATLSLTQNITPFEARDFRSYLLRPVISIEGIFRGIRNYLYQNFGYDMDLSDTFFSSDEFKKSWVTLHMLYELNEEVASNIEFTQEQLLIKTAKPVDYLVSFCKVYGLFIDIDSVNNKIVFRRKENFYVNKIYDLENDINENEITPLSFEKSSYSFDWEEGQSYPVTNYKKTFDTANKKALAYGNKIIRTGYEFEINNQKYIENNIFVNASDITNYSEYYKYNKFPSGVDTKDYYSVTLYNQAQSDVRSSDIQVRAGNGFDTFISILMKYPLWQDFNLAFALSEKYQYHSQIPFPILCLSGEEKSSVSGENVLVLYNNKIGCDAYDYTLNYTPKKIYSDIPFIISDDITGLYEKNCYMANNIKRYNKTDSSLYITIESFPWFSRYKYTFQDTANQKARDSYFELFDTTNTDKMFRNWYCDSGLKLRINEDKQLESTVSGGSDARSIRQSFIATEGHRYVVFGEVYYLNTAIDLQVGITDGVHPYYGEFDVIDTKEIGYSTWGISGELVECTNSGEGNFVIGTLGAGSTPFYPWLKCKWVKAYDLTELGLGSTITTVQQAIDYFGLYPNTDVTKFFKYDSNDARITHSFDFGEVRQFYMNNVSYNYDSSMHTNSTIYDKFWKKYITDLYDIDTKLIKCKVHFDTTKDIFRYFYYYDNAIWCLNKLIDYDYDTYWCTGEFVKVNDINNYIT